MSAGDLLIAERSNPDSEHGTLIEKCMVEGSIVPCKVTVKLLEA